MIISFHLFLQDYALSQIFVWGPHLVVGRKHHISCEHINPDTTDDYAIIRYHANPTAECKFSLLEVNYIKVGKARTQTIYCK